MRVRVRKIFTERCVFITQIIAVLSIQDDIRSKSFYALMLFLHLICSQNSKCRDEARRLLFRHYCDTNRKPEAKSIAEDMPNIETCFERNIYWMLEGEQRLAHLKERIIDDLRYLTWDIWAYSIHANISPDDKQQLEILYKQIECLVKEYFPDKE